MAATATLAGRAVTVTPGGEAYSEVRIQNSGTVVDQFTLEVVGEASPWAIVQPAVVALFPGAGVVARIRFKPPKASCVSARAVSFAVRVKSKEEPRASLVEEGVVVVGPFHDTSARLTSRVAKGSSVARAQLALNNRGNVRINARLTAGNPDRKLHFTITPPVLTAEPGTTTFASISLRPRHRYLTGPPKINPYQVHVHQEREPTITVDGTMQQEAMIPTGLVPAVIGLTAVLLLAVILWFLKPVIWGAAMAPVATHAPTTQSLHGPATVAPVSFSPPTVVINQAESTAPAPAIVTLTNNGDRALFVMSIVLDRAASGDFSQSNNCPTFLRAQTSCQITITLNQIGAGDKRTRVGTLTVKDDAAGNALGNGASQFVPLVGSPAQSAVSFSVQSLSFAQNLGSSGRSQRIILINSGRVPIHLRSIRDEGDFSQGNNCPTVLAPGGTCAISVTFVPSTVGEHDGYIVVADDSVDSPQRIPLTGVSTKPLARLTPDRVNFGQNVRASSAPQRVTLTNRGDGPLTVAGIAATGDFKAISHCPSMLLPGLSCPIDVSFTPQAAGPRTGSLVVTGDSNPSPGSHDTVRLTGFGYQPVATLSTSVLAPGANLGASAEPQTATVTNTGDGGLTVRAIVINGAAAGDYRQSSDCLRTLSPGGLCTVTVLFMPQSYGLRAASLTLYDDGLSGTQSITLRGTGTAAMPVLSSTFLNFGGAGVGSSTGPQNIVLLNAGNGSLAIGGIALAGDDFAMTTNCANTVAAGASCSITVTFLPQATGARSGVVTVTDTAGTQRITLSGVGT